MKKHQSAACISLLLSLLVISNGASSQIRTDYIPDHGYWVIVSNIHIKRAATVQFYNDENQLIYEERITRKKIRLSETGTLRCLKKSLDSALVAFNKKAEILRDKDWIATLLKK